MLGLMGNSRPAPMTNLFGSSRATVPLQTISRVIERLEASSKEEELKHAAPPTPRYPSPSPPRATLRGRSPPAWKRHTSSKGALVRLDEPTIADSQKVSYKDAAKLFRLSRVFSAWKAVCHESQKWAKWASATSRPETKQGEVSKSHSRGLALKRPKLAGYDTSLPATISLQKVFQEAQQKASPDIEFVCYRLALMVPPATRTAAEEGKFQTNALSALLCSVFGSGKHAPCHSVNYAELQSSRGRMVPKLLRYCESTSNSPKVGLTIIGINEISSSSTSTGNEETVGSVSAILHILGSGPLSHSEDGTSLVTADGNVPDWKSEASRVVSLIQTMSSTSLHRRVAILFAVALPWTGAQNARSCSQLEEMSKEVEVQFKAAWRNLYPIENSDKGIDLRAYCVAVTRRREDGLSTGFTLVNSTLEAAATFCVNSRQPALLVPKAADLKLDERLMGYWANTLCSCAGPMFPFSVAQIRRDFETSVDAVVADLQRLQNELEEPVELSLSGRQLVGKQVQSLTRVLWSLRPPIEAWQKCSSPSTFWSEIRRFLRAELKAETSVVACPSWWFSIAPAWSENILRVVVPTPPLISSVRYLVAEEQQQHVASPSLRQATSLLSNITRTKPVSKRLDSASVSVATLQTKVASPDVTAPKRMMTSEPESLPDAKRPRRSSLTDLLKLDTAWSDSLLRSVALLAANLPSGA